LIWTVQRWVQVVKLLCNQRVKESDMAKDIYSDAGTQVIDGKYYWELIFSYDNRDNPGTITRKVKRTTKTSVHSKALLKHKFHIDLGYKFESKASASLKFEGLGEGSASVSHEFHVKTAEDLERQSETDEKIDTEVTEEKEYVIGPRGMLNLYQLCYQTDGVTGRTETEATQPLPDQIVKLKFSCQRRILGLPEILEKFSHTDPGQANQPEWRAIRNSIIQNTNQPALTQFKCFVEQLNKTSPTVHNIPEWTEIRNTCTEILGSWEKRGDPDEWGRGQTDKQLLFKKLLSRFSVTRPNLHNLNEWAEIRALSDKILTGLRELPYPN
jgi:hypothetical protein